MKGDVSIRSLPVTGAQCCGRRRNGCDKRVWRPGGLRSAAPWQALVLGNWVPCCQMGVVVWQARGSRAHRHLRGTFKSDEPRAWGVQGPGGPVRAHARLPRCLGVVSTRPALGGGSLPALQRRPAVEPGGRQRRWRVSAQQPGASVLPARKPSPLPQKAPVPARGRVISSGPGLAAHSCRVFLDSPEGMPGLWEAAGQGPRHCLCSPVHGIWWKTLDGALNVF